MSHIHPDCFNTTEWRKVKQKKSAAEKAGESLARLVAAAFAQATNQPKAELTQAEHAYVERMRKLHRMAEGEIEITLMYPDITLDKPMEAND